MELRNSEIRKRIMGQHAALRVIIRSLEKALNDMKPGDRASAEAAMKVLLVFESDFLAHLAEEDAILVPVLSTIDAWGDVRGKKIVAEHVTQRASIKALSQIDAEHLFSNLKAVRDFIDAVMIDMREEDDEYLNDRLLRDDTIVVDPFTG